MLKKLIVVFAFIGFLSSCSKDDSNSETQKFVPGEVAVGIKSGTDISVIFNFINQFDLKVDKINSLSFTSDLPSDSLQFVLDKLNEKDYTNDGVTWFVTGYLHYQTNEITIFPKLFDMDNIDYQDDWLASMEEFELNHKHNVELNSGIIRFKVPVGEESEWVNQFEGHDLVDWAELNYIADIELHKE